MVLEWGEQRPSLERGGQPGGGDGLEEEVHGALQWGRVTQCAGGHWGPDQRALQGSKEFDQKMGTIGVLSIFVPSGKEQPVLKPELASW